ncbi:MAG: hypothetical protein Q9191_006438 [Dirinaria sp. TL-2023a]
MRQPDEDEDDDDDDRARDELLDSDKRTKLTWELNRGIFQILTLVFNLSFAVLPDRIHLILKNWGKPGHIGEGSAHYPTDFSRDILPLPCHSHNDYWRRVPLFNAIEAGCIGVEADIWLIGNGLYVGHDLQSLTANRTLSKLYIDPIVNILEGQNPITSFYNSSETRNGVFDTDPEQTLILLIDFKSPGAALFPHVVSALAPLRDRNFLTRRNGSSIIPGPVTVVGTGNTPFELVDSSTANPDGDIFFDAPLGNMYEEAEPGELTDTPGRSKRQTADPAPAPQPSNFTSSTSASESPDSYTSLNSYYASVSFSKAIGHLPTGKFTAHQLDLLRGQIRGAHRRGLKARYWDLPFWPIGLRNHVWNVLVREGVDLLNVDDLTGATKKDWGTWRGWWGIGDPV